MCRLMGVNGAFKEAQWYEIYCLVVINISVLVLTVHFVGDKSKCYCLVNKLLMHVLEAGFDWVK